MFEAGEWLRCVVVLLIENISVTRAACFVQMLALAVTLTIPAEAQESGCCAPFFDARQHSTEYSGPGRETPGPMAADEILIAYFGPADASHPEWGNAWRGAQLAIVDANEEGGYQGLPFRLSAAWSENPWGTGVSRLARLVYAEGAWAIVGGVNGVTTHLAEQLAVKARLPLISPGNTDLSVNMTNVPWAFTCLPTDDAQAATVGAAMLAELGGGAYASLATTDHDARATHRAFRRFISNHGKRPILHIDVRPGAGDAQEVAISVAAANPRAVLLIAAVHDAALLARALRATGFSGPIFGGATLARREFAVEAGPAAGGVVAPILYEPTREWKEFGARFRRRYGVKADFLAGQTYDAVILTIAAIREAGLNRARILDAIRNLAPHRGMTGVHDWDATGRNRRRVRLGRIHPELGIIIEFKENEAIKSDSL